MFKVYFGEIFNVDSINHVWSWMKINIVLDFWPKGPWPINTYHNMAFYMALIS